MTFLFGGKGKEKETKPSGKEEEEAKYLRIHLSQLANENETLRQRFEDQKETALQNRKLLGNKRFLLSVRSLYRKYYNSRRCRCKA